MSRFLFYPHAREVIRRLPEFYRKSYLNRFTPSSNFSYFEDDREPYITAANNSLYPKEYFDVPPKVIFPEESQRALWGGEGIITGFIEVKRTGTRVPKTWGPELRQHLFYSEVLDRWLMIIVSIKVLKKIEALKGLDFYLLKTPDNEINSRLGMHIKRDILLKLSDPEFALSKPNIASKYAQFKIPREEADWVGLTLDEAVKKQMKIEHEHRRLTVSVPKKVTFAKALLKRLDLGTDGLEAGERTPSESFSIRSTWRRFLYGERQSGS